MTDTEVREREERIATGQMELAVETGDYEAEFVCESWGWTGRHAMVDGVLWVEVNMPDESATFTGWVNEAGQIAETLAETVL